MPSRPLPGPRRCSPISPAIHRVAIANSRLVSLDERGVTFRCKDYRRNGRARFRTMTLEPNEFIRRFLLRVLPKGFHRIRHYGLLASANIARQGADRDAPAANRSLNGTGRPGRDHRRRGRLPPAMPLCGGRMIIVESFGPAGAPRAPPSPQAWVGTAMP
jgi:hypothetical protein